MLTSSPCTRRPTSHRDVTLPKRHRRFGVLRARPRTSYPPLPRSCAAGWVNEPACPPRFASRAGARDGGRASAPRCASSSLVRQHRLVVHYAARIEAGTRELAVSGAELEVRIHSAPAESPRTIGSCPTLQVRRRYPESFPLLHGHEFGHCAIEHGSIRKLGRSRACPARHGPITDDLKIRPPPAAAKLGRSLKRLPHRLDVSLPSQRF